MRSRIPAGFEWPTLLLLVGCYALWAISTTWLSAWFLPVGIALTAVSVTLHSSLQHEVLHGHPFRSRALNEALVFFPLGFAYPYGRFRDLHLAHHRDEFLTDPYDDPESNFVDPKVWPGLPRAQRLLLTFNNTLLGRLIVGPAIGTWYFVKADVAAIRGGDRNVSRDWVLHLAGAVPVVAWIWYAPISGWAYAVAAYAGLSMLKIRTFLEHRAHQLPRGRSVVVERQGLLSFLFLNNNFHTVHHARPTVAWYKLPALYRAGREEYLRRNDGYVYASYAEIFRKYLLAPKDPVAHPLLPRE